MYFYEFKCFGVKEEKNYEERLAEIAEMSK